jgi:hypothetical protein
LSLLKSLQAIADALGVDCQFCHAPKALTATGRLRLDVAQEMIAMTSELNDRVARATSTDGTRVSCITCHRGVTVPRQLRDILLETSVRQGPAALRGRPPRRPFARELAALRSLVRRPTNAAAVTRLTLARA